MAEYPKGNKMPGMDNAQKVADSKTWRVGVEDITAGVFKNPEEDSGPVVGPPYSGDPLGEERAMITWRGGKK